MTGRDDEVLSQRLLGDGAFAYMRKPFDMRRLVETVRAALARGR